VAVFQGSRGTTNLRIMYAKMLHPPKITDTTAMTLTIVGSMSKYSPIPPHMPQIILSSLLR